MMGDDGTKQIRVMIVEDNADFRALMEVLLLRQPDIKLVSQAGSLAEARANAAGSEPDVAVLDLGLPDGDGVDLIAELRRSNPDVGVLIQQRTQGYVVPESFNHGTSEQRRTWFQRGFETGRLADCDTFNNPV